MTHPHDSRPPICDYEGSNYRTEFWEGRGRDYEDRVERIALERLLPRGGRRLLEVGRGLWSADQRVRCFRSGRAAGLLALAVQYAQENLGRSARYVYVAADAYHLPFHPGVFDAVTMVRVLHHMANVEAVLTQVRRVLVPNGVFILEHANKRNLKSMVRHALKKQDWNPYDLAPVEFVELNFDFHPEHIRRELQRAGFDIQQRLPVSLFRLDQLKDNVPLDVLTRLDGLFQPSGLLDHAERLRAQRGGRQHARIIWGATCCSPARNAAANWPGAAIPSPACATGCAGRSATASTTSKRRSKATSETPPDKAREGLLCTSARRTGCWVILTTRAC